MNTLLGEVFKPEGMGYRQAMMHSREVLQKIILNGLRRDLKKVMPSKRLFPRIRVKWNEDVTQTMAVPSRKVSRDPWESSGSWRGGQW